jgi:hypothetical protein
MQFTPQDIDVLRQWFDALQDTNPQYLDQRDYDLASRLYEACGMRVPNSLRERPAQPVHSSRIVKRKG